MKKQILIFLVFPAALLVLHACISSGTAAPASPPTSVPTLHVTPTRTPIPVSEPWEGSDVLLSPDGTKKAVYDAVLGWTFQVVDTNGKVLWSITYDNSKFKDIAREAPEPWYKPFYWSRDGRFLYYTCFHGQETDGSGKFYGAEFDDGCGVFRLDVETGKSIDILPEIVPGNGYYAFAISPDEKHLAYTYQNETPVRIRLLDMETRQERILLTADEEIAETGRFGWSPQGDKLAYMTLKLSEYETRTFSIWLLDVNSLETKLLVKDFDVRIRFVSWDEQGLISYLPDEARGSLWQLTTGSETFSVVTITPQPFITAETP